MGAWKHRNVLPNPPTRDRKLRQRSTQTTVTSTNHNLFQRRLQTSLPDLAVWNVSPASSLAVLWLGNQERAYAGILVFITVDAGWPDSPQLLPSVRQSSFVLYLRPNNMADPVLLPLRPSAIASQTKDSLQLRIAQINKQKGAFRHVTEASLLEEIKNEDQSDSDVNMENGASEDPLKPGDRQALLWKGREAMLQQIEYGIFLGSIR